MSTLLFAKREGRHFLNKSFTFLILTEGRPVRIIYDSLSLCDNLS